MASDSLDEIAANYSMIIIKIASALITWVLNTMFEGITVDKDGLNRSEKHVQKGPCNLRSLPQKPYRLPDIILSSVLQQYAVPSCCCREKSFFLALWALYSGAEAPFS